MGYYLGVDGGQSGTAALIGDSEGRVVGQASGGPCNHVQSAAEGRAKFLNVVGGVVREACARAGLAEPTFEAAALGFSGGPADKQALVHEILKARHIAVSHDALVALVGACAGEPGLVTIAGTGSIAFGRNTKGMTARAGGWGYIFGDEGGAFDIVRRALRAALRMEEGWGLETSLHDALLEETGAPDADSAMHLFYTAEYPRSRVAKWSAVVDREAIEGDEVARVILHEAAGDLARIAWAVRNQLFAPRERARIAYVGGVFRSEILLAEFRRQLATDPGNIVAAPEHGPAAGALIEAYRLAGLRPQLVGAPKEK